MSDLTPIDLAAGLVPPEQKKPPVRIVGLVESGRDRLMYVDPRFLEPDS